MNDIDYILGLMRQNTQSLGFIPDTRVGEYVQRGYYIVHTNQHERGYILHSPLRAGRLVSVTQAVIDVDYRSAGHGMDMLRLFLERCKIANVAAIKVGCAADLPSNQFWQAAGFPLVNVVAANNTRNRAKNIYRLPLWRELWT